MSQGVCWRTSGPFWRKAGNTLSPPADLNFCCTHFTLNTVMVHLIKNQSSWVALGLGVTMGRLWLLAGNTAWEFVPRRRLSISSADLWWNDDLATLVEVLWERLAVNWSSNDFIICPYLLKFEHILPKIFYLNFPRRRSIFQPIPTPQYLSIPPVLTFQW